MSEKCHLLCEEDHNANLIDVDKRYDRKKYEGKRARTAVVMALVLMLPALYILGKPYPRLMPTVWSPQMQSLQIPDEAANKFLVWNPQCRIPEIDPHSKEAMELFRKRNYVSCATGPQYVNMAKNERHQSVLHINKTALRLETSKKNILTCCYISVARSNSSSKVIKSPCVSINESVVLSDTEEFVMTLCNVTSKFNKHNHHESHKTHKDVFMNVQPSTDIQRRLHRFKSMYKEQPYWNVLIIGVDTLSRINMARAMPKTHQFFKSHNWLDFQGYNKIDDNTFPNLMAILTGRNSSRARLLCDGYGNNSLDHCDFMWKTYENSGYVTAYAEDDIGIDTFEKPYHKGFSHKPTDHYLRPLFQVAEKNMKRSVFCTGQKTSGEVLFQYALELVERYKNDPYFAFLWANTFSHDDVGSPSTMDEKLAEFLQKLSKYPIEKTIIIFISDHGIRFGNMRATFSGFYEERLPAFYMYVPDKFKETHKDAHLGLITNTKRLINPYDVYMTLQDILYISGRREIMVSSEACSMCQSLFQAVPWNRSCADCSITPHWCTCTPLKALPLEHRETTLAIHYILNEVIEDALRTANTKKCRKCAKLSLNKVISKYVYDAEYNTGNVTEYLVVFSTTPGDMTFEATVRHDKQTGVFTQIGIVSRLSEYKGTGYCVDSAYLKKYCFCTKKCK